jgi:D-glycero-beta-D-manno-heptose 1-phosphate adenylyltransferase
MSGSQQTGSKILSRPQLGEKVQAWKRAGEQVILANGCFDLLHVGHIRYLHAAKQLAGRLVVAINADESVRAVKGPGRPLMPASERAEIIAALADVDAVVIFSEPDVRALIRELRPDVQAKGTDYTADSVPERDEMIACGGRVEIVGDPKDHSTSSFLDKIALAVSGSIPACQSGKISIGDPAGEFGNVEEKR